jgi:hypothetical protein
VQWSKGNQRAQGLVEIRIDALRSGVWGTAVDDTMAHGHWLGQVKLVEVLKDGVYCHLRLWKIAMYVG